MIRTCANLLKKVTMNIHHVVARNRYLKPNVPVDRVVSTYYIIVYLIHGLIIKIIVRQF